MQGSTHRTGGGEGGGGRAYYVTPGLSLDYLWQGAGAKGGRTMGEKEKKKDFVLVKAPWAQTAKQVKLAILTCIKGTPSAHLCGCFEWWRYCYCCCVVFRFPFYPFIFPCEGISTYGKKSCLA